MAKKPHFKPVDPKQDFVAMEKQLLDYWYSKGIVKKYLQKNKNSKKKFSFLDGPITANNPMGVHHAWGRTYKDLWQRFYNMQGYSQRFQNGFDEQGLWVEVEVEKELGFKNKKDIEKFGIDKFVNLCKERVKKYSAIQTEQSKRLGYFMDWDNSYHTSSDENNYAIWNFLKVCHEKGYLYKGRDSVPWCPRCGTAISQHEILTEEYQEVTHKAVFIKYRILNSDDYLIVWTTTPWTLPSNVAIAINPSFDYWRFTNTKGENIIIVNPELAREAGNEIISRLGLLAPEWEVKKGKENKFKGAQLVEKKYRSPFDDLPKVQEGLKENLKAFHTVVAAKELVNAEEGTGFVHIAPGAGEEDFDIAQKENLPVIESIDEAANYIEGFGDLTGQNAKENPDLVIQKLEQKGVLFRVESYTHRYPVCWRCKTELVWRVVDEWYIAMDKKDPDDKKGRTLRLEMVDVAKKINWIPQFGLDRELDWLKNMHDWLISKKRYWGLALPIWECTKCGNFEVIGSRVELKQKAIEGWEKFDGNSPHRSWIDNIKIKCSKCESSVSRIPDVGNPWLDAGIVPFSTMPQDWFPADFITESFPGQFKNWFYSLIAMSTVLKNASPARIVLGFATLLDEKGEEMHKSKGNAIEFNEAADKIGVDVMRWIYIRQNPVENLLFGYHRADEARRWFYLRLWNVYAFFTNYAVLDKWKPRKTAFYPKNILDQWLLSRLYGNIKNIEDKLKIYDTQDAAGNAEIFIIRDLSNWYIRRIRERIGPSVNDFNDKSEAYQTLWFALTQYCKVLACMIPFASDEIYRNLTGEESVHLTNWPQLNKKYYKPDLERKIEHAIKLASVTFALRKGGNVKVRIPLKRLSYTAPEKLDPEIEKILRDEVNVYEFIFEEKNDKYFVNGSVSMDNQDVKGGEAREIIRQIQQARKDAGCRLDEKITVQLPNWPKGFEDYIKKETLAAKLVKGTTLKVIH